MEIRKIIKRPGLNVAIAGNVGGSGSTVVTSVSSHEGVVQKGGKTEFVQVEPEDPAPDEQKDSEVSQ
jgi:hypothetical protein